MNRWRALAALAAIGACLAAAPAAQARDYCDPFLTAASFRGDVPAPKDVIGIDLGERDVTTAESDTYLDAVDRSSPRVVSGTMATSVQGRPLRYAVVGKPGNVTPQGLERIAAANRRLRDPSTPAAEAARIAAKEPAILWIAGNVHGGEESGTDASLRVLRELADRDDCAAKQVLENAIVVINPTQNPDGREADTRRNAYDFDMNRDWFARTQPETEGKLELLRRYPPVLFIDSHEMGNLGGYFFPPNADPIYHEITDQSVGWINGLYGKSMQDEFGRQGIPYFNYDIYDLFYMGYGDTVPSTGFGAAGMTFEKTSSHTAQRRAQEQYVAMWTSLGAAVRDKAGILRDWHAGYVEARRQGAAGELEPNEVVQPTNTVQSPVPADLRIRHYFLRADDAGKSREVQALVRRLQRMDVRVQRLTAPLEVPDFKAYGRPRGATTLPAGTYWISMAQGQKHWVQAMLHEDPYTPFPYFYDVTGWSQPMLFNLSGGSSGATLSPRAEAVPAQADPGVPAVPANAPRIALLRYSTNTAGLESSGWLRWLLDTWGLPYDLVTPAQVAGGALAGKQVLLLPDGSATTGASALGAAGRQAVTDWANAGGRTVSWAGGTALAARLGLTKATLTDERSDVPGSQFRVQVDQGSPLAAGVGGTAWAFYEYDDVMRHPDPSAVAVRFPETSSGDWFVSGFADGEEELGGTAAVVDESVGAGRTVAFSVEPNFRGFTTGTQKLLRNAILGPDPVRASAARVGSPARATAERRAAAAARRLPDTDAVLRLTVRRSGEAQARRLLARFGAKATVTRAGRRVRFTIANPKGLVGEEHPYARQLGKRLKASGLPVVAFSAP